MMKSKENDYTEVKATPIIILIMIEFINISSAEENEGVDDYNGYHNAENYNGIFIIFTDNSNDKNDNDELESKKK